MTFKHRPMNRLFPIFLALTIFLLPGEASAMLVVVEGAWDHRDTLPVAAVRKGNAEFCPDEDLLRSFALLKDCCCLRDTSCPAAVTPQGMDILRKGFAILADRQFRMSGACWHFANRVYDLAGYPADRRKVVYSAAKGTLLKDPGLIQPGDWLYHVNYSYNEVEHSAIFVCWKDYDKRIAVTLGHVGRNRRAGGELGIYDLKAVYRITRAK